MAKLTIYSPIDDRPVGTVPAYSRRDVDRVLAAAAKAQVAWAARKTKAKPKRLAAKKSAVKG